VSTCVSLFNNQAISQLQKLLTVEGYFWAQDLKRCGPFDLDILSVNVLPKYLIKVMLSWQEVSWALRDYLNGGRWSWEMATD
jgi:hypothetical protein